MGRPPALDAELVRREIIEFLASRPSAPLPELRRHVAARLRVEASSRTLERYCSRAVRAPEFELWREPSRHGPTVVRVRLRD